MLWNNMRCFSGFTGFCSYYFGYTFTVIFVPLSCVYHCVLYNICIVLLFLLGFICFYVCVIHAPGNYSCWLGYSIIDWLTSQLADCLHDWLNKWLNQHSLYLSILITWIKYVGCFIMVSHCWNKQLPGKGLVHGKVTELHNVNFLR